VCKVNVIASFLVKLKGFFVACCGSVSLFLKSIGVSFHATQIYNHIHLFEQNSHCSLGEKLLESRKFGLAKIKDSFACAFH
jgi:hypothetical protein